MSFRADDYSELVGHFGRGFVQVVVVKAMVDLDPSEVQIPDGFESRGARLFNDIVSKDWVSRLHTVMGMLERGGQLPEKLTGVGNQLAWLIPESVTLASMMEHKLIDGLRRENVPEKTIIAAINTMAWIPDRNASGESRAM